MSTFSGLTPHQVVLQSYLCHPDWDAEMHLGYLEHEEGFNPADLDGEPLAIVTGWLGQIRDMDSARQFGNIQAGLLPAGTRTPHGEVVATTLTAYQMGDGTFVPFVRVHGRPAPVEPLVRLG